MMTFMSSFPTWCRSSWLWSCYKEEACWPIYAIPDRSEFWDNCANYAQAYICWSMFVLYLFTHCYSIWDKKWDSDSGYSHCMVSDSPLHSRFLTKQIMTLHISLWVCKPCRQGLRAQPKTCCRLLPWQGWIGALFCRAIHSKPLYSGHLWTRMDCPDYRGVLISGVEDVLWFIVLDYLVPVAGVHNSEIWIRGVLCICLCLFMLITLYHVHRNFLYNIFEDTGSWVFLQTQPVKTLRFSWNVSFPAPYEHPGQLKMTQFPLTKLSWSDLQHSIEVKNNHVDMVDKTWREI